MHAGKPHVEAAAGGGGRRQLAVDQPWPLVADGNDLEKLQGLDLSIPQYYKLQSLEEMLARDKQRASDGFPRKLRLGKLVRPGPGGRNRIVVVPSATEEKFFHDNRKRPEQPQSGKNGDAGDGSDQGGGSGKGAEGEVIAEQPIHAPVGNGAGGAGGGDGSDHDVGSDAYELGRILTEKFALPNLKKKGRKPSLTRSTYELTDRNSGHGQVLDKKATLLEIIKTNINLGLLPDPQQIDPTRLLVHPGDNVYRILSRETHYESHAVVFFLRDYSGSMSGAPTELVVSQHIMIYSWLVYQYQNRVETRFIVHDTNAKEVPDFNTYYNSTVAGGTNVSSAFHLVNSIVAAENLAVDCNIYVFYGGDGDDWNADGKACIQELEALFAYANRVGITIAKHSAYPAPMERYLRRSGLLEQHAQLLRLDVLNTNADEDRVVEGIRTIIAE